MERLKRLRKVGKGERKIFGVCGGISRYLDPELDPIMIRLLWLTLTVFSPFMLLIYIAFAFILNTYDEDDVYDPEKWEKEYAKEKKVKKEKKTKK
jgi:phage shock protein PspC (stress-responsive transcriptional regulator)